MSPEGVRRIGGAAQVLHEGVPGCDVAQCADRFHSVHRSQSCFEAAVIGLHSVGRVPPELMPGERRELVDDPRVNRRPIGGDLDRSSTTLQRAGEERPRRRGVAVFEDEDVDDLSVLIDRPVQVGPAAGDLHVGLIHEPPITSGVTQRPGGVDELGRERLHPSIHPDVVDLDTALAQQLLHVAVPQAVTQLPAHRDRDHLPRER